MLMYNPGNWVKRNGVTSQIESADKNGGTMIDSRATRNDDSIERIKITPKILIVNDFKDFGGKHFHKFDVGSTGGYIDIQNLDEISIRTGDTLFDGTAEYVDELQDILRACKLPEIADNFVIPE